MVKAVDGKKVSQYYAGEKITCIGAPKLSSVKNYTSSVKIKWKKVTSADGYYVYRKGETGAWEQIAKVKGGSKVSYTDKTVSCSETYQYTVRAYDGKVKGCFNDSGLKTIFLKNPSEIEFQNSDLGLVLNFGKIEGAQSYDVYRKTLEGEWEKLSSIIGSDSTSFIDLDVEDGETYLYSVKALNGEYTSYFNKTGVQFQYSEPDVEETTENTDNTENEEVVA